ncbi:hypothetical protein CLOP_g9732 [Closterium sp. NIES-67]|nr:hypothetical protein CLOP_g9732 [Closterium sp. NIES-67]
MIPYFSHLPTQQSFHSSSSPSFPTHPSFSPTPHGLQLQVTKGSTTITCSTTIHLHQESSPTSQEVSQSTTRHLQAPLLQAPLQVFFKLLKLTPLQRLLVSIHVLCL